VVNRNRAAPRLERLLAQVRNDFRQHVQPEVMRRRAWVGPSERRRQKSIRAAHKRRRQGAAHESQDVRRGEARH
jgi:hypothetical protein